MKRYLMLLSLLTLFSFLPLTSQEEQSIEKEFHFGVSIGTVTLGEDVYNSVRLLPEFTYGKLGAGLDVDFRFTLKEGDDGNTDFKVYPRDWYPEEGGSFPEYLNLYLSKFAYIRWGKEEDPLFVRFGSLGSTTLGTGYIMGGYTNTLLQPEKKIFGGQFNLKGELFDFPYLGVQGMLSNVSAVDLLGGKALRISRLYTDTDPDSEKY